MEENNYTQQVQNSQPQGQGEDYEEIDIMELLLKLLSQWKKLLLWCGISAVVGVIVAFSIPKEYTVTSKLAPEIVTKTSGSVASIASMLGANISNMSTNDAVYPDLYPDIVSSTPFVTELFSLPVQFKDKKEGMVDTDYYTYIKEYSKSPWWSAVLSAPMKGLSWFIGLFKEKQEKVEGYSNFNPEALTTEQSKIAKAISESISVVVDKKTQIITLTVTSQSPFVSKAVSDAVIEKIQEYVTSYRTEKSRKDMDYYLQLYEEAKADYYKAQQKYASYVDANQGVVLQRVKTEQERLQNEMQLAYQLYNSCAQQLQMSRAKVQQETPVCVVMQPPVLPNRASKPSKITTLVACVFLGFCLCAVWILWGKDWIAKFRSEREDFDKASQGQQS
ncbi:MAG TPA: chain-length determining protein [Rikenellaceae bacterium]|nr:chain-length determining protein [Rikenellaceae bacterium]